MASDDQQSYQVRAEWGAAGLARLATTDIVVVVDVLRFSSTVTAKLAGGSSMALDEDAHAVSINGAVVAEAAQQAGAVVLMGALTNADAVARAVLQTQVRRGGRTSVSVIACGERVSRASDQMRFAVEDQLGAGAIISALTDLGIDHTSPEAAVMGESFRALKQAVGHLLLASAAGRELIERGRREDVVAASTLNSFEVVPVLETGIFRLFE